MTTKNRHLAPVLSDSTHDPSERGIFSALTPNQKLGALGMGAALAVGAAVGAASINEAPSPAQVQEAAEAKATAKVNKLHVAGKSYEVTVPTGGTPEGLLKKFEPGFNDSTALRGAMIKDIESQAPEGAPLQALQQVKIADIPGGESADRP